MVLLNSNRRRRTKSIVIILVAFMVPALPGGEADHGYDAVYAAPLTGCELNLMGIFDDIASISGQPQQWDFYIETRGNCNTGIDYCRMEGSIEAGFVPVSGGCNLSSIGGTGHHHGCLTLVINICSSPDVHFGIPIHYSNSLRHATLVAR